MLDWTTDNLFIGHKTRGARRFLIAAKKAKPDVTMQECMEIAGFTDPDEKKNTNLAQSFRSKIFNPIRDHVALVKFNVSDVEPIFGRTGIKRTKEQLELRKKILDWFPAITRERAAREDKMDYIDDLINA
jgi:hypothetical protein